MTSLLRRLRRTLEQPRDFANPNFVRLPADQKIEEETFPDYFPARYYPVVIGEVFVDRYQVVGKLGFGAYSTVWLARDLKGHRHVALKVFIRSQSIGSQAEVDRELNMYERMAQVSSKHPGRDAVRSVMDAFTIIGPDGAYHQVLVHEPLFESVRSFLSRNPVGRLPSRVLAIVMQRLFLALDFLHTECHIIHTDISAHNIMFGIDDDSILTDFEEQEMIHPSPRKQVNGRTIYTSRVLKVPKSFGPPVLCDFGSAVLGDEWHDEDVQPDVYRSPEVILKIPWDYMIDIWNSGCMVWDIYEGGHLFFGKDPEDHKYRGRAHMAEIVGLLGLPPGSLLARSRLKSKFFSGNGAFDAGIDLPTPKSLHERETNLSGREKERFILFMRRMLQWMPECRSTAGELFTDPWLQEHGWSKRG